MKEKVLNQLSDEIRPITFQNNDPINYQLEKKNILVALQTTPPLHYVVYPMSEANSSTHFNLLI